ncbi:DUF2264 domain-containing protein [Kribbella sp. CA-293567]|uniref:DUF2264 domain-containing protein n=1 Tax=Kribbella sp. CA-293567 TaxID=3002436 RepID=UPI0022DD0B01|nr:DUF2264 domain-containing protein [Kribbella sp. CA-293567]WBQ08353.1 DUF2264 domain-containing protein [Kribbella sp. CA-293567]
MTEASYTGLTRDSWAGVADQLLLSLRPWSSPDHARIDLPGQTSAYGPESDSLEAFARSFLLAAIRLHGEGGRDPHGHAEWYADGLRAGTDPASPHAWPRPDELGQAKVEACSIALGLHLSRPWLWDRLQERDRERIVGWLATVVGEQYPPINWVWFQIVVETFLKSVGGPWSPADIDSGLVVHESLARDHGWYADGPERAFDHYNGWALHVYPLLWASMDPSLCPAGLEAVWRERLATFLRTAVHLVGGNGSPLLQGRSLTYRFAAAAPFWMGAITGATDLSPGVLRRTTAGMLGHFLDRGVPDERGLLTLGWYGEWPAIAQSYSGPGSPYWAVKGMLGLMLPADHAVWTAKEEPLPVEESDFTLELAEPGWVASGTRSDGIVRIANHGTDHSVPGDTRADSPLYARLAYSTHTMPPMSDAFWAGALENSIAVVHPELGASHRNGFTAGGDQTSISATHWVRTTEDQSPRHGSGRAGSVVAGPAVAMGSLLKGSHEVRAALIDPDADLDPAWSIEFSGWPLSGHRPPADSLPEHRSAVRVGSGELGSSLTAVVGFEAAEVRRAKDASAVGGHTAIPVLTGSAAPGRSYVAIVSLAGGQPEALPRVEVAGTAVRVEWADGSTGVLDLPLPSS